MTNNKKGFTLIELVVVMAIIAVLAALMVGAISAARQQATNTQRVGNVKTVETALETRASKCGGNYFASATNCTAIADTTSFTTLETALQTNGFLSSLLSIDNDAKYVVTTGIAAGNNTYTIKAMDNSATPVALYTATR